MNAKAAHKLVATIAAHSSRMPVTLFLYGDFVEAFPQLVKEWSKTFTIGMRESQPFPLGDFTQQLLGWIRVGLVSAIQRLSEVGLQPAYYCPENITDTLIKVAKSQGLRIIQPTARFPQPMVLDESALKCFEAGHLSPSRPVLGEPLRYFGGDVGQGQVLGQDVRPAEPWRLSFENYYKNIDVDRIPKALRVIAKQLDNKGGIVTLDSDHPDSYMISVFLMDYLPKNRKDRGHPVAILTARPLATSCFLRVFYDYFATS
ncbi:hypothetical protein Bbelb_364630 [Branchiostoma belcheri]|nr:hypothetical protein Bbelb_364630 [Branchiostoma belcheri]